MAGDENVHSFHVGWLVACSALGCPLRQVPEFFPGPAPAWSAALKRATDHMDANPGHWVTCEGFRALHPIGP